VRLINTGWIPLSIALLFGYFHPAPPLWELWPTDLGKKAVLWYLILAPVGEELLFRGLIYDVTNYVSKGRWLTATNPLPVAAWVTAFGFSLWHAQNFSTDPAALVGFQMFYTFFVGLWFGFLRWKSGKLWLGLGFHCGLNLLANVA